MKSQLAELSALLDGEFEPHEVRPMLDAIVRENALRDAWDNYVLIGDQMRQERLDFPDLTASVMAKICEEPVVLAPRNLPLTRRHHPLLALAASVAGVAVVGWLAMAGSADSVSVETKQVAVSPAPTIARALANPQAQVDGVAGAEIPVRNDMSEYLLAHHTQASTFRLGDNTQNIRTVSLTGRFARP